MKSKAKDVTKLPNTEQEIGIAKYLLERMPMTGLVALAAELKVRRRRRKADMVRDLTPNVFHSLAGGPFLRIRYIPTAQRWTVWFEIIPNPLVISLKALEFKKSPWLALLPEATFPEGMGNTVEPVSFQKAAPKKPRKR